MTIERAPEFFNPKRRGQENLVWRLEQFDEMGGGIILERKDKNLVETIKGLREKKKFPIVDKGLKMVFGINDEYHMLVRGALYEYHYERQGETPDRTIRGPRGDKYIREGMGYYFSAMRPEIIVAGLMYRPDKIDEDLFAQHHVDYTI